MDLAQDSERPVALVGQRQRNHAAIERSASMGLPSLLACGVIRPGGSARIRSLLLTFFSASMPNFDHKTSFRDSLGDKGVSPIAGSPNSNLAGVLYMEQWLLQPVHMIM